MNQPTLTSSKTSLSIPQNLNFYNSLKSDYNCEKYLECVDNAIQRKYYTKFRISNHKLMTGRYDDTEKQAEKIENAQSAIWTKLKTNIIYFYRASVIKHLELAYSRLLSKAENIVRTENIDKVFGLEIMKSKDPVVIGRITRTKRSTPAACSARDGEPPRSSCRGDGGGPFVQREQRGRNAREMRWVLSGILSWNAECGARGRHGYFTRVAQYVAWVRRTTTRGKSSRHSERRSRV